MQVLRACPGLGSYFNLTAELSLVHEATRIVYNIDITLPGRSVDGFLYMVYSFSRSF